MAAVPGYSLGLFLSTDNNLSSNDVKIGDLRTGKIFPGIIPNINAQLIVSSFVANGPYQLILNVDNEIEKSNEKNNDTSYPVNVASQMTNNIGADINLSVELNEAVQSQFEAYTITYIATNVRKL